MQLKQYLIKNNLTLKAFSQLISVANNSVVSKYVKGTRIPRPEIQTRIFLATNGSVTPSDFIIQNINNVTTESTDLQLLKQELEKSGIQQKYIAYELGITPSALSQKLEGKISFKTYEIKKIFEILKGN